MSSILNINRRRYVELLRLPVCVFNVMCNKFYVKTCLVRHNAAIRDSKGHYQDKYGMSCREDLVIMVVIVREGHTTLHPLSGSMECSVFTKRGSLTDLNHIVSSHPLPCPLVTSIKELDVQCSKMLRVFSVHIVSVVVWD